MTSRLLYLYFGRVKIFNPLLLLWYFFKKNVGVYKLKIEEKVNNWNLRSLKIIFSKAARPLRAQFRSFPFIAKANYKKGILNENKTDKTVSSLAQVRLFQHRKNLCKDTYILKSFKSSKLSKSTKTFLASQLSLKKERGDAVFFLFFRL